MRQLKSFMKAKKRGRCKCLALNMWRCWEFCACTDSCWETSDTNNAQNEVAPVIEPTPSPAPVVEPEPTVEPEPEDGDNVPYEEPEVPEEVLENPTEESLDDLNS